MFIYRKSAPAFAAILASLTLAGVARADVSASASATVGSHVSVSTSSQGTSAQIAGVTVSASSQGVQTKAGPVSASTSSQGTQVNAGSVGVSTSRQGIKANAGAVSASSAEGVNVDGLGVKAKVGQISVRSNGSIDPAVTVEAGGVKIASQATTRMRARRTAQSALRGTKRIVRHTVRSVRSLLDIHVSGTVNVQAGPTNALLSIR